MTRSLDAIALAGWIVAAGVALMQCGDSSVDEQVHSLTAKQVTVAGNGTVTIADGVIRIADGQGRVTVLDANGVHGMQAPTAPASAGPGGR